MQLFRTVRNLPWHPSRENIYSLRCSLFLRRDRCASSHPADTNIQHAAIQQPGNTQQTLRKLGHFILCSLLHDNTFPFASARRGHALEQQQPDDSSTIEPMQLATFLFYAHPKLLQLCKYSVNIAERHSIYVVSHQQIQHKEKHSTFRLFVLEADSWCHENVKILHQLVN